MPEIYDARDECCFEARSILFDTNVWIAIYGNDPRSGRAIYSDFYASALKKDNRVFVSDQILSEYFNRVCKVEYQDLFGRDEWHLLKDRRKNDSDFRERVESVRDTCLNILDDCEYVHAALDRDTIGTILESASQGDLDLTDAGIALCCENHDLILVSDDGDFADCGFPLVTANNRTLAKR